MKRLDWYIIVLGDAVLHLIVAPRLYNVSVWTAIKRTYLDVPALLKYGE